MVWSRTATCTGDTVRVRVRVRVKGEDALYLIAQVAFKVCVEHRHFNVERTCRGRIKDMPPNHLHRPLGWGAGQEHGQPLQRACNGAVFLGLEATV